jgi:hypothetical protein
MHSPAKCRSVFADDFRAKRLRESNSSPGKWRTRTSEVLLYISGNATYQELVVPPAYSESLFEKSS